MVPDRKKEVINVCLDHFIEKGLSETSTRSLSRALQLQNAGLYYYFESKDEAVIQCAEEAALRLENALIPFAIKDIDKPDDMMKRLQDKADELAPTMSFFVSVCVSRRYKESMKPVLDRLAERYDMYTSKIAALLNCEKDEIEAYVYMTIAAAVNYMIFAEDAIVKPQLKIVKCEIEKLYNHQNCKEMHMM